MSKVEKPKYKKGFSNQKPKKGVPKCYSLGVDQRGFLCSCNNRERDCIRESYNILNKYADILYPIKREEPSKSQETSEDIEDELKNELSELKSETFQKRFQAVKSGTKNFIFIRTTIENPTELAHKILSDINETKTQQSRFLLRLVPIEITCKAYVKDIEKAFESLAEKHFKDGPKSYSIMFNHRNNDSVNRDEVIKGIADIVSKVRDDHKVDLKNAEISIVVEVVRGFALIGIVPDFIKLKKYNLMANSGEENAEIPDEPMEQQEDEKHEDEKQEDEKQEDEKQEES